MSVFIPNIHFSLKASRQAWLKIRFTVGHILFSMWSPVLTLCVRLANTVATGVAQSMVTGNTSSFQDSAWLPGQMPD
ncbi:hypothetical protein [Citrobacter europaeus]|nr:hypothetical protein [Citrobacter europaeus]UBI16300.1 hypothetical protein LA337_00910 [Citrobacter europaeus]